MKKQIIGTIFILISSILYSAKYVSAAISGANSQTWGDEEFLRYLSYFPITFNVAIISSFIVGAIYIGWGISDFLKEEKKAS